MDDRKVSCANCIYGDYWHELDNWDSPEEFGFDCSYPSLGSKLARNLRADWNIDDEDLAIECNVHAYCEGVLASVSLPILPPLKEIHYCPYSQSYFSWKETGTPIVAADLIVVIDNRVLCTSDVRQPQLSLF